VATHSVPEARRLAAVAMSRAAHDLGRAWSRWRRRHQARARCHHYHARVSQNESSDVSTQDELSRFVAALGGTLKLIADFDDEQLSSSPVA
jgi:hypothetical protein